MCLPDAVAVKLSAYTLFCRQLLSHLPALRDATRADQRLTCTDCCQRFNESLDTFFHEAAPRDLEQAANILGVLLQGRAGLFEDQNPQAAAVFHRVVKTARGETHAWCYQDDLEIFHQQGRQLAYHYYAGSPWPVTQARLDRRAQLLIREGAEKESKGEFRYHPVPLAFRQQYRDEETDQRLDNVILMRFGYDRDFSLYLAYPYLFMHEYVAHIFASDYDNERFNDGWMLHAADCFLARRWRNLDIEPPLKREQSVAFGECLYSELLPIPRDACRFARDFEPWLGDPEHFRQMTWEMAAFEPLTPEDEFWPNTLINRLSQEFDRDHRSLRRKIETAPSLRALFEALSPV